MASTDARPVPEKNVAFRLYADVRTAAGVLVTSLAGADSEVSLDGAAFGDCTNEITEIGTTGVFYIDLTAAELNADSVVYKLTVTNTGALTLVLYMFPEETGDIRVNPTAWNSTAVAVPNVAGIPQVDATKWVGGTIPAPAVTGVPKLDLTYILGTLLTESVGGYLVAAFKMLFNVPTPTLTAASVNQTGDSYTRLGAAGAGLTALGDTRIANLDATVSSRLAPTVAARTLDVSAGGEAGMDWANIGAPTTAVDLSGTTVKNVDNAIANVTTVATTTSVTNPVTVGTNSDKTGYSLSSAGLTAIWDVLLTAILTTGSIGKLIKDYLDAAISSRLATSGYTAPDNATIATIASNVSTLLTNVAAVPAAVWAVGTRTLSSFGTLVADVWAYANRQLTAFGFSTGATAVEIRQEMDANSTKLANLDAAVSTRSTLTAAQVWASGTRTLTSFGTLVADIWAGVPQAFFSKFFLEDSGETYADAVDGSIAKEIAANASADPTTIAEAIFAYLKVNVTTAGSWAKYVMDTLATVVARAIPGSAIFRSSVARDLTTTLYYNRDLNSTDGLSLIYPVNVTLDALTDEVAWNATCFDGTTRTITGSVLDEDHIEINISKTDAKAILDINGAANNIDFDTDFEAVITRSGREIESVLGALLMRKVVKP